MVGCYSLTKPHFLPRSKATKQSILPLPLYGLLRFARNDISNRNVVPAKAGRINTGVTRCTKLWPRSHPQLKSAAMGLCFRRDDVEDCIPAHDERCAHTSHQQNDT